MLRDHLRTPPGSESSGHLPGSSFPGLCPQEPSTEMQSFGGFCYGKSLGCEIVTSYYHIYIIKLQACVQFGGVNIP